MHLWSNGCPSMSRADRHFQRIRPLVQSLFCLILLSGCFCKEPEVGGPAVAADAGPTIALERASGQYRLVSVEVAWTRDQITRGMMHRAELGVDSGMLFIFPGQKERRFWMKNTLIPLDMIFISSEREIVGIVKNAVPHSLTSRTVGKSSRYVLEVNGGYCESHGIESGSRVQFFNLEEYGVQ